MTAGVDADAGAGLDIRIARLDVVEVSASILEEVAAWGASAGLPSWLPGTFTGSESVGLARLCRDAECGNL